jgi:hypothetical protein
MTKLVALSNKIHQSLKVDQYKVEETIADLHMLPVVVTEFAKLVVQFPIAFTKNADTGQFVCICLLGFDVGENLFWHAAKFDSIYTPLNIVRHPFFVGQDKQTGEDYVVCIDEQSPTLSSDNGHAIFDEHGQATHYLHEAQQILAQLLQGEKATEDFIACLLKHNLLVPFKLDITFADHSEKQIKGLYSVDEEKLGQLSPAILSELMAADYLSAIYTQLASLGQIYALIERKNQRLKTTSPWFENAGEDTLHP